MENADERETFQYVKTEKVLPSVIKVEETGCLVCGRLKKFYSCRQCKEMGYLSFLVQLSTGTQGMAEKAFPGVIYGLTKQKIQELQELRKKSTDELQKATGMGATYSKRKKLLSDIVQTKKRIETLDCMHTIQAKELKKLMLEKRQIETNIEQLQRRSQRVQMKKTKITEYMMTKKSIIKKNTTTLAAVKKQLQQMQRQQVSDLVTHIFPIVGMSQDETVNSDESLHEAEDAVEQEDNLLEEALAEARRLSFVHGRWIYDQGEGPDLVRISIGSSKVCAPADGDYTTCLMWLKTISHTSGGQSDTSDANTSSAIEPSEPHKSSGASIYAALCLATQLMHIIRKLLYIHLPYKHHYRQFSDTSMTNQEFLWNVHKLNGNVLALCLHYGVEPNLIHPLHTLPNIQNAVQMFLHNHESATASVLTPELVSSMEEALNDSSDPLPDDDEDKMEELLSEWENSLADEDWEALAPKQFHDLPHPQYTSAAPFQSQAQANDMGASQGLMSSAVAWVTKGWWNR